MDLVNQKRSWKVVVRLGVPIALLVGLVGFVRFYNISLRGHFTRYDVQYNYDPPIPRKNTFEVSTMLTYRFKRPVWWPTKTEEWKQFRFVSATLEDSAHQQVALKPVIKMWDLTAQYDRYRMGVRDMRRMVTIYVFQTGETTDLSHGGRVTMRMEAPGWAGKTIIDLPPRP